METHQNVIAILDISVNIENNINKIEICIFSTQKG